MSQEEAMHRYSRRSKILSAALIDARDDLDKIYWQVREVLDRDKPDEIKDLDKLNTISYLALRSRASLDEANK